MLQGHNNGALITNVGHGRFPLCITCYTLLVFTIFDCTRCRHIEPKKSTNKHFMYNENSRMTL